MEFRDFWSSFIKLFLFSNTQKHFIEIQMHKKLFITYFEFWVFFFYIFLIIKIPNKNLIYGVVVGIEEGRGS